MNVESKWNWSGYEEVLVCQNMSPRFAWKIAVRHEQGMPATLRNRIFLFKFAVQKYKYTQL